jgi:hypothetical protein
LNPRQRRHVATVSIVVCVSALVGAGHALAQQRVTFELIVTSILHGVSIGFLLTMFEIWLDHEPGRSLLARLPFTATLILRSVLYVLVIVLVHLTIMAARRRLGIAGGDVTDLVDTIIFSSGAALAVNFVIQVSRRTALSCSSISPVQPGWPSDSAESASTVFSIARSAF